jgi:hypothetical protein
VNILVAYVFVFSYTEQIAKIVVGSIMENRRGYWDGKK